MVLSIEARGTGYLLHEMGTRATGREGVHRRKAGGMPELRPWERCVSGVTVMLDSMERYWSRSLTDSALFMPEKSDRGQTTMGITVKHVQKIF